MKDSQQIIQNLLPSNIKLVDGRFSYAKDSIILINTSKNESFEVLHKSFDEILFKANQEYIKNGCSFLSLDNKSIYSLVEPYRSIVLNEMIVQATYETFYGINPDYRKIACDIVRYSVTVSC